MSTEPKIIGNMFVTDRILRAALAGGLLLLVLRRPDAWDWPFVPELTLLSGYVLVTALCAWDPVYELAKNIFTRAAPKTNPRKGNPTSSLTASRG